MSVLRPPRDNYLDRLNIRNKGIERWALASRRRHFAVAGVALLLGLACFIGGLYSVLRCEFQGCYGSWEVAPYLLFPLSGLLGVFLLFHLVLIGARWTHNHRLAEWELEFGQRLDSLEEMIGSKADTPAATHKTRDLLGATVAGDFLGERLHVRADFWNGFALFMLSPAAAALAMMVLFAWWGESDAEVFFFLALPFVPFVLGFRLMAKRTRRLADLATQKHLATLETAMEQKLELPSPSFVPYLHAAKSS